MNPVLMLTDDSKYGFGDKNREKEGVGITDI
jgi:hypothetical protein